MFEMGFMELVLVAIIGLLVLGPQRLPKVAAEIGKWVGRARRTATQLRRQLEREIELAEIDEPAERKTPPTQPAPPARPPDTDATPEPPASPAAAPEDAVSAEPEPTIAPPAEPEAEAGAEAEAEAEREPASNVVRGWDKTQSR